MAELKQPTETQALVRLSLLVIIIILAGWVYDRQRPTTHHLNNNTSGSTDLKVQSSDSSASGLQQSTSPIDNTNSVQSGQSNLQPAQNSAQLPDSVKQDLGL